MTANFKAGGYKAIDANGNPYSGARLYFYAPTTTTPKAVYSNAGLSAAITQPATADSGGQFDQIFMQNSTYRVQLKTSGDVLLEDWDDYDPGGASGASGTLAIANGGTAATTTAGARTNLGLGTAAVQNIAALTGTWTFGTRPVFNSNTPWDTGNLTIATQAEQETGTSVTAAVTPGRQHFHPSAAKFWAMTTGAGTPVLTTSYNVTSLTDTGTGQLTITIATDFSSANWCGVATASSTTARYCMLNTVAAGTVLIDIRDGSAALADPSIGVNCIGFGDHA